MVSYATACMMNVAIKNRNFSFVFTEPGRLTNGFALTIEALY